MTINPARPPAGPPLLSPSETLWLDIKNTNLHGLYRATALQHLVRLLSGMTPGVRFQNVEKFEALLDDPGWAFPPTLVADPLPLAFVDALWTLEPDQRAGFVKRIADARTSEGRRALVWQILPARFREEAGLI